MTKGAVSLRKNAQKCCHCEPVTDVTGVAIPRINEKTLKLREIPTPVVLRAANYGMIMIACGNHNHSIMLCALARNDSFILCAVFP